MKKSYKYLFTIFLLTYGIFNSVAAVDAEEIIVKSIDEVPASWASYKSRLLFEKSSTHVSLDLKLDKHSKFIESFRVVTEWGEISIPSHILRELVDPQLNTIDISYTPWDTKDPDWAFSIRFFFGDYFPTMGKDRDDFNMVEISVDKNSIIDVTIFDAKTDSSKLLFESK